MSLLTKQDCDPILSVAVHRTRFISLCGTATSKSILLFKDHMTVKDMEMLLAKYHSKVVEQETDVMMSLESYLNMQLWAVAELLSLEHRLVLNTASMSPPPGPAATQQVLASYQAGSPSTQLPSPADTGHGHCQDLIKLLQMGWLE